MIQASNASHSRAQAAIDSTGCTHFCNGLNPARDGGMVPSILGFAGALAGNYHPVRLVTPTPSRLDCLTLPDGVELVGPERDLVRWVRQSRILHVHGLWQIHARSGARAARRFRVPYVISAHGMADPWALNHKKWKKRVYTWIIEGKNLRYASCLHALAQQEVDHLRALAPRTPIALVPNGVDLRPFDLMPTREAFERLHPELRGKFVLLFLGRLHAKKGLDLLVDALERLWKEYPNLHMVLAGRDDGARHSFLQRVAVAGFGSRVTDIGHVSGSKAMEVWSAADAFVLPSHSEGFSMAVLEALAARLPVVITTACNFDELARAEGGIVVEPTVAGVESGLRGLLERSQCERGEMAMRGRSLVERAYTWPVQARKLAEVYEWLVGGGSPPDALQGRPTTRMLIP